MKALVAFSTFCFSLTAADVTRRAGKYEVSLRISAEGLFAGEEMQIEYRVVDTSRIDPLMGPAPVIRAATRSKIIMPAMRGMAAIEETAHAEGVPGEYGIHPAFPHGGEFLMELSIKPPNGEEFQVSFPLNVGDASQLKNAKPKLKPYLIELKSSPKNPKAGESVELTVTFRQRESPKQIFQDFVVQHEKLMHLMIVRSDLGTFSHEHPSISADGSFRLRYTFPTAGEFHLFGEVAPKGAGSQVLLAILKVTGKAESVFNLSGSERKTKSVAGDATVDFPGANNVVTSRKTIPLALQVNDSATGNPVTDLQPYLGAMGHLILIHEDGVTMVHSHPAEETAPTGAIPFLARFPKAGLYRGWVQFRRGGSVRTADFVISAAEGTP